MKKSLSYRNRKRLAFLVFSTVAVSMMAGCSTVIPGELPQTSRDFEKYEKAVKIRKGEKEKYKVVVAVNPGTTKISAEDNEALREVLSQKVSELNFFQVLNMDQRSLQSAEQLAQILADDDTSSAEISAEVAPYLIEAKVLGVEKKKLSLGAQIGRAAVGTLAGAAAGALTGNLTTDSSNGTGTGAILGGVAGAGIGAVTGPRIMTVAFTFSSRVSGKVFVTKTLKADYDNDSVQQSLMEAVKPFMNALARKYGPPSIVIETRDSGHFAQVTLGQDYGVQPDAEMEFYVLQDVSEFIDGAEPKRQPFAKGSVIKVEESTSWVEVKSHKSAGVKLGHFVQPAKVDD